MRRTFLAFIFLFAVFIACAGAAEDWKAVSADDDGLSFKEKMQQKVDIDYKNADVINVLRSFAWTYKLNIITSPEVKGEVTLSLKGVTVEKAIEAILRINGLAHSMQDGIIYISPGDTEVVELISEVIFLNYVNAADARNLLSEVVSPKGDMKIDELANSIIITDYASTIEKVKKILEKVDVPPQQVLIEAKVVDIASTDLGMLGFTWNIDYAPGHGIFGRNTEYAEEFDATMSMAEQSSGLSGGQFTINTLTIKGMSATATLDALLKDGKAKLLASPSIAVLNGQEARIIIGERYPIKERTQTTTGTTETTSFVDIGTTLRVTPQINEDGYITMRVHPEVSSLAASLDAGPRITTREADTKVRIKEGETLVIGGLIKQAADSSVEKIPILGELPFIGFLFSRRERSEEQKELAVFITPKILRSREEMARLAKEKVDKEEVYVNITKTGELHIAEHIFDKAEKLERGKGIESRRKEESFRKEQALSLYENVYYEFPDSPWAAEALYRAGVICLDYLKDYRRAKNNFARLISDYPMSKYAKAARKKYKKIESIQGKKRAKKEIEEEKKAVSVSRAAPPKKEKTPLPLGDLKPSRTINLDILGGE